MSSYLVAILVGDFQCVQGGVDGALRAVLTELAAKAFGLKFARWRRIQERDAARVKRAISPLMEDILPRLSRKKVWLDEKPSWC